jgi:hypothetical protein
VLPSNPHPFPSRSTPEGLPLRELALVSQRDLQGEGGSSRRKGVALPPPSSWILIPLSANDESSLCAVRGEGEGGEAERHELRRAVVPMGALGEFVRISLPQGAKESRW